MLGIGADEGFGIGLHRRFAAAVSAADCRAPPSTAADFEIILLGHRLHESRIEVTSAIFSNFGLALMSFRITGFGMSQTARISTQSHFGIALGRRIRDATAHRPR